MTILEMNGSNANGRQRGSNDLRAEVQWNVWRRYWKGSALNYRRRPARNLGLAVDAASA